VELVVRGGELALYVEKHDTPVPIPAQRKKAGLTRPFPFAAT
jgi:hypothetical protein